MRRSSIQNVPFPPGPAAITSSIAPICEGGPPPAGPYANLISLLRIRTRRHSGEKSNASSRNHQTLWPVESASLNSKLLGGPAPRTANLNEYCSGSASAASLRATTKPAPPLKSKSSRNAAPCCPASFSSSSCARPEATVLQRLRSSKSSSSVPDILSRARLRPYVSRLARAARLGGAPLHEQPCTRRAPHLPTPKPFAPFG